MKTTSTHLKWPFVLPAILAASLALAGCGGGGGGSISNKTLTGTLLDANRVPLVGATVVYDSGTPAARTTTTTASGAFRFVLPLSSIGGSDTLTYLDSAGHVLDVEPLTLEANVNAVTITTVAPPTPPVGV